MTERDEILARAQEADADACWVSDDADENCLLIAASGVVIDDLIEMGGPTAYEDPNDPPTPWTRIVFPNI